MRLITLFLAVTAIHAQTPDELVKKIQSELSGTFPPADGKPDPNVPHGQFLRTRIDNPASYPGTENAIQVYVPAQYDPAKPACLLLKLDNFAPYDGTVLDNLIARKEVPVIIGVGISPGTVWKDPEGTPKRAAYRYDRSYEFDSTNDRFPGFVLNEVLPAVQKLKTPDGRPIRISPDGNDHAVTGGSTGGIGAFTLAWRRPDQFSRVYTVIGTFVSMRGGNEYPVLIRKTDPQPIRMFLEDGSTDAWNPLFGSWFDANLNMESALSFSGYDVAHAWGEHGHNGQAGQTILPDVLRWLWRDYPAAIRAGISKNSTLQEITLPGESWRKIPQEFEQAVSLATGPDGEVFLSDTAAAKIYRLDPGAKPVVHISNSAGVSGLAFGPDGKLYGLIPPRKTVVVLSSQGEVKTIAEGIAGKSILVKNDGAIYVSEPGAHSDMPSRIWKIQDGKKTVVDEGIRSASGIAFSPDGILFYAAENTTKWVNSYIVRPNGSLSDRQPYFWLHMTDVPNDSGALDLAGDVHGNLYVATRMGIQVCDLNGRVRAILPLPAPSGPALSLAFGGPHLDTLFVTDGKQVFARKLKVVGYAQWSAPVVVPPHNPG